MMMKAELLLGDVELQETVITLCTLQVYSSQGEEQLMMLVVYVDYYFAQKLTDNVNLL